MVDALPEAQVQKTSAVIPDRPKPQTLEKAKIGDTALQRAEEHNPSIRGFLTDVASKGYNPLTQKTQIPKTDQEIEEIALQYGVTIIGMGSESVVFAKPSRTGTPTKEGHEQVVSLFWYPRSAATLKQIELVSNTLHTLYPNAYPLLKAYQGTVRWNNTQQEIPVTGTVREKVHTASPTESEGQTVRDTVAEAQHVTERFHLPFNIADLYDITTSNGNVQIRQTETGEYTSVFLDTVRGSNSVPDLIGFANYLRGNDPQFPRSPLPEREIIRLTANIQEILRLVHEDSRQQNQTG